MKNFSMEKITAYIINLLLSIIGFLLVISYNRTNTALEQINRDVLNVNKEIVSLKLELTELNSKMMTDERVRELIHLELQKTK